LKLSKEAVKEIASELDMGMICYINRKTLEFKTTFNPDSEFYIEDELIEKERKEIEKNWGDYFIIKQMRSNESFRVMEKFADQIADQAIKGKLFSALGRRKPFSNFKYIVDSYGDIREEWFRFKEAKGQEYVEAAISDASFEEE